MKDFLKIYVLFHTQSKVASEYADRISSHFDSIGMDRDGVSYRVPVRFRSEPWKQGTQPDAPRPIDLLEAEHNVIILLHDDYTAAERELWNAYIIDIIDQLKKRNNVDIIIPFQNNHSNGILPCLAALHHARQENWNTRLPDIEARIKRLLLHILFCIRYSLRKLDGSQADEPLFVSHAKADGDPTAKAIVDYVNDSSHDVPLSTFYDAMELAPGQDFQNRFEQEIGRGTLLAISSDVYDSRPWCIYELTQAKRARRPILLADVGRYRTGRTYPYGANVPKMRLNNTEPISLEALLVEALSEGLRCDLFLREADMLFKERNIEDGYALPRPPELLDIVDRESLGKVLVYPDPPIGNIEQEIIEKALKLRADRPNVQTLGELR